MGKYKRIGEITTGLLSVFVAWVFVLCCAETAGATQTNWLEGLKLAGSADVIPTEHSPIPPLTESNEKLLLRSESNEDQTAPEVKSLSDKPGSSLLLASAKQTDERKVSANPAILAEFDELQHFIAALTSLNRCLKTSLTQKVANAKAAYGIGQPCTALRILGAYLNETQELRRGSLVATAEQLYAFGRLIRHGLASLLPVGISCPGYEWLTSGVSVKVLESDNVHVRGRITFGEPSMGIVMAGGETFTQVTMPGSIPVGQIGLPGVPIVNRLLAFPRGANVSVSTLPPVTSERLGVSLYPFQHEPADSEFPLDPFGDWPFVKDGDAYSSPGPFPPAVCTIQQLGQLRDLPIAQLSCATGQYNPVTNGLTLFRSIDFHVQFDGGSGFFVTGAALNPFEPPLELYSRPLLNNKEVSHYVEGSLISKDCAGEELLIITPASLVAAAQGLAQWKQAKGIATTAYTVDASWTAQQINGLIKSRYDNCTVRPSYVLLFGDAELIPTFYVTTDYAPYTASDYPYSAYGQPPFPLQIIPFFGVGRIPVDTLQQAWDVVNKIINYESTPPSDAAFYQNVTLTSAFQCCRTDAPATNGWPNGRDQRGYIQASEFARNILVGQGYTVQRIYMETFDTSYYGDDKPRSYYDGTFLPSDIGYDSGFPWSGSKQDIVDAFNQGRFLFMQRDHGSWDKWSHPELTKDDVDTLLTNGEHLPVVFSISCSTGFYDNETNPSPVRVDPVDDKGPYYPYGPSVMNETYFTERLLRKANGGAVGVISATRDSPSWAGDALAEGLFDAVWPGSGSANNTSASIQRLGDMLNHAKIYVFTAMSAPGANTDVSPLNDVVSVLNLFHVFGDPTLEMWTSQPLIVLSPSPGDIDILTNSISVTYDVEGATITALQVRLEGESDIANWEVRPIGRAQVTNGVATLVFVNEPWSDLPILLSASKHNAVSVSLTPGGSICLSCDVK